MFSVVRVPKGSEERSYTFFVKREQVPLGSPCCTLLAMSHGSQGACRPCALSVLPSELDQEDDGRWAWGWPCENLSLQSSRVRYQPKVWPGRALVASGSSTRVLSSSRLSALAQVHPTHSSPRPIRISYTSQASTLNFRLHLAYTTLPSPQPRQTSSPRSPGQDEVGQVSLRNLRAFVVTRAEGGSRGSAAVP